MCELLGMSANVPTDLRFSFTGLMRRAGVTGRHSDGFGIVFHDGNGCRAFHDPAPGAHSPLARFLIEHPIPSLTAIAHIRRANRGRVSVANTHPFVRELWGRSWSFAHNGQLRGIKRWPLSHYTPVGTTDSEHAFCWFLDQLRRSSARMPQELALARSIATFCRRIDELGTFNALLSDGIRLYAFCSNRLVWLTRRAPFGRARLIDEDMQIDFADETSPDDVVTVVATTPLTADEEWQVLAHGALAVFRAGERILLDEPQRRAAQRMTPHSRRDRAPDARR